MTAGQKAAVTRTARNAAKKNNPVGYKVALLVLRDGYNATQVAAALGISDYSARGHMTRVTRGDYSDCRL